jgi:hypothetical protein
MNSQRPGLLGDKASLVFPKLAPVKINPKTVTQEDKIGGKIDPKNVEGEKTYFLEK